MNKGPVVQGDFRAPLGPLVNEIFQFYDATEEERVCEGMTGGKTSNLAAKTKDAMIPNVFSSRHGRMCDFLSPLNAPHMPGLTSSEPHWNRHDEAPQRRRNMIKKMVPVIVRLSQLKSFIFFPVETSSSTHCLCLCCSTFSPPQPNKTDRV